MDRMDTIIHLLGVIIFIIGILILIFTFGYWIFFIFGKIGVTVYIAILMIIIGNMLNDF